MRNEIQSYHLLSSKLEIIEMVEPWSENKNTKLEDILLTRL